MNTQTQCPTCGASIPAHPPRLHMYGGEQRTRCTNDRCRETLSRATDGTWSAAVRRPQSLGGTA